MKHVRPLVLAAFTLALLISGCSQPADLQAPTLAPQFGTAEDDVGVDVAVSSSGLVYVLADQFGPRENGEGFQVLLRRYDSGGELRLYKQVAEFTCPDDPSCSSFRGRILGVDGRGNTYTLVAQEGISGDVVIDVDYDLYKLDAAGRFIRKIDVATNFWSFEDNYENAIDMAVDGSGNVYLAFENGVYEADGGSSKTDLVVKYAANGTKLWQRTSTVGTPFGITVSARSGSVFVAGTEGLARYTNDGTLSWSVEADNSDGYISGDVVVSGSNVYTRSFNDVRKYDGMGRQLWLRTQGGLDAIRVQDVSGDTSGNLYLSGRYRTSAGDFSAFARKVNLSGAVFWTKTYGTPAFDDARGIATLSGSEIYTTGETQGSLAHPNRDGPQNRDGYLRKLNSSGNPVWTR